MWGEGQLMALYLVHCEPIYSSHDISQWYMPPLYSSPDVEIQPYNPLGDVLPNKFLLPLVAARSKYCDYFGSSK